MQTRPAPTFLKTISRLVETLGVTAQHRPGAGAAQTAERAVDPLVLLAQEEGRWRDYYGKGDEALEPSDFDRHFNASWYKTMYPDVAAAGVDPLQHYLTFGHAELRDPSPEFSTAWYLEHNPWVSRKDGNSLAHSIIRRGKETRPRVALFGYSWSSSARLDPYMKEVTLSLARLGLNVDVYIGNEYSGRNGVKGLKSASDQKKLAKWVAGRDYKAAISFNNSMIMPDVIDALPCKVVSVIVDSRNHLFDALDGSGQELFSLDFLVAPIYTSLAKDLEAVIPGIGTRIKFLPPATSSQRRVAAGEPGSIPISWIASLVGDHKLDEFMQLVGGSSELVDSLRTCVAQVETSGHLDASGDVASAVHALASAAAWNTSYLEVQIQNIVTNRKRLAMVERLAPLGLHLYGNDRWTTLFHYNAAVLRSFRGAHALKSHSDLMSIYNSSRLCVNAPQTQAGSGMQYRIVDVLASNGLLLTEKRPESDLDLVFGADNPIVTFDSLDDLAQKCMHYLDNESERVSLVRRGNHLVSNGFSFAERVEQYMMLSAPAFTQSHLAIGGQRRVPGSVSLMKAGVITLANECS